MKPMMQNRYVGWMAIRPLQFGDEHFAPGDRVPQRLLDPMRDPEVLVRTGRLAAVAKDMNKVPRYLRKDVTAEDEMRDKILMAGSGQIGAIVPGHLVGTEHDPNSKKGKAKAKADAKAAEEALQPGPVEEGADELDPEEEPAEGIPYPTPPVPSVEVGEPAVTTGDKDAPEGPEPDGEGEAPEVEQPPLNATTEAWAEHAVNSGQATPEEVEGATRTELIEKYGQTATEE